MALLVLFVAYALQVRYRPYLSPSERADVLRGAADTRQGRARRRVVDEDDGVRWQIGPVQPKGIRRLLGRDEQVDRFQRLRRCRGRRDGADVDFALVQVAAQHEFTLRVDRGRAFVHFPAKFK